MPNNVVLYHANCYDGFGAAWAAWKALGDDAVYIPRKYGQPIPEEAYLPDGQKVYMVDYSMPRREIEFILGHGIDLQIIDHHKSAKEDLEGLDCAIFDMSKSGAGLTWEFFHPGVPMPRVIQHIQDRDLWQWKLDSSKEVHAALCSFPFDFVTWDKLIQDFETLPLYLLERGRIILEYHEVLTEGFNKEVNWMEIGGHRVPVVNVSLLFSEAPHDLLAIYPDAPFAAYIYLTADDRLQVGLRGRGDMDMSEIAKLYGGGGHRDAAGFVVKDYKIGFWLEACLHGSEVV